MPPRGTDTHQVSAPDPKGQSWLDFLFLDGSDKALNVRCTPWRLDQVPLCQPGGILGETTRAVAHSEASHGPRSPCNSSPLSAQGQCTPCKGDFRKKHLTLCFNNPPRLRSCAVVTTHAPQSYPCFTHVIPLDRTVSPIARPRSGS